MFARSCEIPEPRAPKMSIGKMEHMARHNTVISMHFSLSAQKTVTNSALQDFEQQQQKRKTGDKNTSTVFLILVERAFHDCFCGNVQMERQTVNHISSVVTKEMKFVIHKSKKYGVNWFFVS